MASPYVIISLKRYKALTKHFDDPDREAPVTNMPDNRQLMTNEGSKSHRKANIAIFKQQLRKNGIEEFENEDALINQALGTSKKVLVNQEQFYRGIFASQLQELIKNPHIWHKYGEQIYSID